MRVSVPSRGKESNNKAKHVWRTKNVTTCEFPSPLGAKSPTIKKKLAQWHKDDEKFPSPLGAKSPTIALTKHAEYDY